MMSLRQNEEEKKQWEEEKRMAGAYFCTYFLHIFAYFIFFFIFSTYFLHSIRGKRGRMQMDGGKEKCIIMKNQNEMIRSSKICAGVKEKEEKEEKVLLEKKINELEEEVRK